MVIIIIIMKKLWIAVIERSFCFVFCLFVCLCETKAQCASTRSIHAHVYTRRRRRNQCLFVPVAGKSVIWRGIKKKEFTVSRLGLAVRR